MQSSNQHATVAVVVVEVVVVSKSKTVPRARLYYAYLTALPAAPLTNQDPQTSAEQQTTRVFCSLASAREQTGTQNEGNTGTRIEDTGNQETDRTGTQIDIASPFIQSRTASHSGVGWRKGWSV